MPETIRDRLEEMEDGDRKKMEAKLATIASKTGQRVDNAVVKSAAGMGDAAATFTPGNDEIAFREDMVDPDQPQDSARICDLVKSGVHEVTHKKGCFNEGLCSMYECRDTNTQAVPAYADATKAGEEVEKLVGRERTRELAFKKEATEVLLKQEVLHAMILHAANDNAPVTSIEEFRGRAERLVNRTTARAA